MLSATNNNSCACGFRNKTFLRQCNQTLIDPTIVVCNLCPDSNIHMREWSVRTPAMIKCRHAENVQKITAPPITDRPLTEQCTCEKEKEKESQWGLQPLPICQKITPERRRSSPAWSA